MREPDDKSEEEGPNRVIVLVPVGLVGECSFVMAFTHIEEAFHADIMKLLDHEHASRTRH